MTLDLIPIAQRLARQFANPIATFASASLVKGPPKDLAHRLDAAFRETERTGLMLATVVRIGIILALVVFFASTSSFLGDGYLFLIIAPLGLLIIGLVQFFVVLQFPQLAWPKYVFIAIDCAYLAALLMTRHVFANDLPPVTTAVKEGALLFFTAFLVHAAFSYSPRFVLWTGACITLAWGAVLIMAITTPGTFFRLNVAGAADSAEVWRRYGDASYLPVIKIVYDYVIVIFLTLGLAVAVWRSRRLVQIAAMTECVFR